ncbi:unnamed protein product, partial [Mycena citricolor]
MAFQFPFPFSLQGALRPGLFIVSMCNDSGCIHSRTCPMAFHQQPLVSDPVQIHAPNGIPVVQAKQRKSSVSIKMFLHHESGPVEMN